VNSWLKTRRQNKPKVKIKIHESIEFGPNGEVIGWCKTLKKFGFLKCENDCDECLCG